MVKNNEEKSELQVVVETQLSTMSPLLIQSQEYLGQAKNIKVKNDEDLVFAKLVKRNAVAHRTYVTDQRKKYTSQIDSIKAQFMQKEQEILAPSKEAESLLRVEIETYTAEQEAIKQAERDRVEAIVKSLHEKNVVPDRKTATVDDLKRAKAMLKAELSLLATNDRNKKAVKEARTEIETKLDETLVFVTDRVAQEAEAARLKVESDRQAAAQAKIDAERKAIDEEKQTAKDPVMDDLLQKVKDGGNTFVPQDMDEFSAKPTTGVDMGAAGGDHQENLVVINGKRIRFEIMHPEQVEREYCYPDEALIAQAIKDGVIVSGVDTWEENADGVADSE